MFVFDYWKARSAKMPDSVKLKLPGEGGDFLLDALAHMTDPPTADFDEADKRATLDTLYTAYALPLHRALMAHAHSQVPSHEIPAEDAADVVNDFFADLSRRPELLVRYDRSKSRLRTYLKLCLESHYGHLRQKEGRVKRGGGRTRILDLRLVDGEPTAYPHRPSTLTPDEALELDEAWSIALGAIDLLRRDASPELQAYCDVLRRNCCQPTARDLAAATGRDEAEVRALLPQFKEQLRWAVFQVFYQARPILADATDRTWNLDSAPMFPTDDLLNTDVLWKRMIAGLGLE